MMSVELTVSPIPKRLQTSRFLGSKILAMTRGTFRSSLAVMATTRLVSSSPVTAVIRTPF